MYFERRQYRPLGNTGLAVSPLGLGTVKFGRNTDVKYPSAFDIPDRKALSSLLAVARECGINLIDTAPAYGHSEERLGELLKGVRNEWVIATKVGEEYEGGVSHWNFSETSVRSSIERSLKRLQTDHLDIVLVHSNDDDVDIISSSPVLDVLEKSRDKG
ncbi:MAG: aldo/keto reductase, partial [Pseudohongiellaceae bacterium]